MIEGTQQSDDVLFVLLQRGDMQAFEQIYVRYNKMLYTLSIRLLKNDFAAENVVQHVFAKLWENRFDITVSISLRNYLYTMTKNYVLNYVRNKNNALVKNYEMAQSGASYDDDLLTLLERKEMYELLNQAIEKLPEQKRMVVMLKREGLTNQEIADKMNISINTVKTHYQQCVKMLKDSLRPIIDSLPTILVLLAFFNE